MSPIEQYQRQGDWFELRKEFKQVALIALRKREGLPQPVDESNEPLETRFDDQGKAHYYDASGKKVDKVLWAGTGKDGKPGGFAIGTRKGEAREIADVSWGRSDNEFQILEVSEDGRKLEDEIRDLHRDSATYERAERVSHGLAGEQAPDFELSGTSDEEIDAQLQEYIKRGQK